ncbi:MAG: hypothetical protein J6Y46_02125 [Prevotella sp.]|nr:hypothetical protein [Prevotella sp.]
MAKDQKWQDDYWLLLMQLYLKKPVGIKQMYSKAMVNLSMELHVAPQVLFNKMCEIANLQTPRIERIWQEYGKNPRRLSRAVSLLRQMKGFGNDNEFYEGVDVQETFERDFRPVNDATSVTPVMLILILDLYFRLTPITMVPETPEIQELGRLMKIPAREVADIMDIYQHCDPYLNRKEVIFSSLFPACQEIWQRYGNIDTEELSSYAQQLKAYFNS